MAYIKQNWHNLPNQTTPISAQRLNHLETQYDEAVKYFDDAVSDSIYISDYGAVGDGVFDNRSIIQGVINSSSGKRVVFDRGQTYAISGPLIIEHPIHLDLNGASILRSFDMSPAGKSLMTIRDTKDVVLSRGTLDGNGINFPGLPEPGYNLVNVLRSENIEFSEMVFKDVMQAHCLDIVACHDIYVSKSSFEGYLDVVGNRSFSEAIQLDPDMLNGGTGSPSTNIVVQNSYFGPSDTLGFGSWPVGVGNHASSPNSLISGIVIRDNFFDSCTLSGTRPIFWSDLTIENNTFKDCPAVRVATSTHNGTYLRCKNFSIIGNRVYGSLSEHAFQLTSIDGLVASGNQVSLDSGRGGFSFWGVENAVVEGNLIQGASENGIYVASSASVGNSRNVSLLGNVFKDAGYRAIHVSGDMRDIILANNSSTGSSWNGTPRSTYQIDGGVVDALVVGNLSSEGDEAIQPDYGIYLTAGVTSATVIGNHVFNGVRDDSV